MLYRFPLLLLMLAFAQVYGQEAPQAHKQWQVELGYQHRRILDLNASPLVYAANGGSLGFQFQKEKNNRIWQAGAKLSIGSNQSKRFGKREAYLYDTYALDGTRDSVLYELNPGLSYIQASVYYASLWAVNSKLPRIYLGGKVENQMMYSAIGADVWFINQLSLMPTCELLLIDATQSKLKAGVSLPIISYILRPPYAYDPSLPENSYFNAFLQTGSSLASLNTFQQINLSVQYAFSLQKGKSIGLNYGFMWMNHQQLAERNLRAYSNQLTISYHF